MSKTRVFIADVDAVHVEQVTRCLSRCRDMEVVGSEGDGCRALRRIADIAPDVLLTDIQLPGLDGILLLKDLRNTAKPPVSIVCTRFYSDLCVTGACRYGAEYFLYKPIDYNRLPEIIRACVRSARRVPPSPPMLNGRPDAARASAIRGLLSELGIPSRLTGSLYLTEALMWIQGNDALLRNLSKGLYAEVAARLDTTAPRVERSLRNAIANAFESGAMRRVFPERPTNRELIEYLMRRMADAEEASEQRV